MTRLPDGAINRLRDAADWPDTTGTKYQVLEKIGQGGMGSVYLAEDQELARKVALKVVRAPVASGQEALRMRREARIIAGLEHPGIVPVHDIGTLPDGRMFYVMKWVRGEGLAEHVRDRPLSERLRLFLRICDPVAFAHANGVIHRDLKPANIMVGQFGEVMVLDWGIARVMARPADPTGDPVGTLPATDELTGEGAVIGTQGYMAPEQAGGQSALVDQRTDVYALGAILRSLLVGRPRPLLSICTKALSPPPDQRYESVTALSDDLVRYLDGQAVRAHREGLAERAGRVISKYRTPILLVLAYLLMRMVLALAGDT